MDRGIFYTLYTAETFEQCTSSKRSRWRANFYRIDYDNGESSWEWQKVKINFHDYELFGHILFD